MATTEPSDLNRRTFLRRSAQLAAAGPCLPLALNLAAIGEAAALTAVDYKALVCVFLHGGNDQPNTVVPFDLPSHDRYLRIRAGMAVNRSTLTDTVLRPHRPLPEQLEYALHPTMRGLAGLFNDGRAAVQLNVGPLVVPTTKRQYQGNLVPLPPKLFSHFDQRSLWQSAAPEGWNTGWGGRLGDLALASNGLSQFTCISPSGSATFLSGPSAHQYQVSPRGATGISLVKNNDFGPAVRDVFLKLATRTRSDILENEYNKITQRSISAELQINAALAGVQLTTPFANESLGAQMQIVARLIGARGALGAKRQLFFVSIGDFDLHDFLMAKHPDLLMRVSSALTSFYNATVELGVADKVTAFTASDFGRTLSVNRDGSDHGWGSHQFVVGGAVNGAAFYGAPPPLGVGDTDAPEDAWHVGQGRLLPTTSVDQFAATLARWFGVGESELAGVLPNLSSFGALAGRPDYPGDLGFLRQA